MARRWMVLGAYAAAIYGTLPYGPAVGRSVLRSPAGSWLLGPGIGLIALAAGACVVAVLWGRRAPSSSYVALALAGGGTMLGLAWLRAQHLERVHLPEYAVAAWLAWRALDAHGLRSARAYVGAALIAAALGVGDELLQAVTPGRVCDVRDMMANALGGTLGVLLVAALHKAPAGGDQPAGATVPRTDRELQSAGG